MQHYPLSTTLWQYPHLALSTFSSLCVCACAVCMCAVCLHASEFQVRTILTWPVSEFSMPLHNISGCVTNKSKCWYCQLSCEWMNACLCCVSWLYSCHVAVCLVSMRCSACIQHSGYIKGLPVLLFKNNLCNDLLLKNWMKAKVYLVSKFQAEFALFYTCFLLAVCLDICLSYRQGQNQWSFLFIVGAEDSLQAYVAFGSSEGRHLLCCFGVFMIWINPAHI